MYNDTLKVLWDDKWEISKFDSVKKKKLTLVKRNLSG